MTKPRAGHAPGDREPPAGLAVACVFSGWTGETELTYDEASGATRPRRRQLLRAATVTVLGAGAVTGTGAGILRALNPPAGAAGPRRRPRGGCGHRDRRGDPARPELLRRERRLAAAAAGRRVLGRGHPGAG